MTASAGRFLFSHLTSQSSPWLLDAEAAVEFVVESPLTRGTAALVAVFAARTHWWSPQPLCPSLTSCSASCPSPREIPYHGQDLAFSLIEFWVTPICPFRMSPWTARNKTNGKDRGVGKEGAISTCYLLSPAFVSIPFIFKHFACVLKPQDKAKCLRLTYLCSSLPSEVCLQQQELHQLGTSKCLETAKRRMETSQIYWEKYPLQRDWRGDATPI